MTYLPNPLNEYDTYTYNIKLYVCHPFALNSLEQAIKTKKALLLSDNAQIAKFSIDSCEHIFTVGYGKVREAIGSRFNMKISEPSGVTLLPTIKKLCDELNIINHVRAGYIIAIEFVGRKKDGKPHKFPQTFYYPCVIQKFNFKIDSGGTNYDITFVENSQIGYQYLNNVIKEQIVVEAQTVGEFIDRFEERLNRSLEYAWRINPSLAAGVAPDRYKFEFDETTEDWRNWRFEALDKDFEVSGVSFVGVPGEDPKLQVIATNGSNITSIISQVLQLTAEYKKIVTMQNGKISKAGMRNAPEEQTSRQLDSLPVFFKLMSNVEYGAYDEFKGDYTKTIKYKIKSYVVPNEVIDSLAYSSSITDPGVQNRRVDNLFSSGLLRKRFDYLYTGMNTEILDIDMTFDYAYYYILPYGDGYLGDPEVMMPQISKDRESIMERLSEIQAAKKEISSIQRQLDKALTNKDRSAVRIASSLGDAKIRFQKLLDDTRQVLSTEYNFSPTDISYMLRFNGDVISDQDFYGSDNNTRSGTLKMGAVKANLENAGDMVTIELAIRGDPYWMGKPNSFYNQQKSIDELADYEAGAPMFFLNVNLPVSDEDANGRKKPRPDMHLSGVYMVKSVINRFEGGTFIQYLEGIRDLATNIPTVYEKIAGENNNLISKNTARRRTGFNLDNAQIIENARRSIGLPKGGVGF